MINSYDEYFKVNRNKIPLKNQRIVFDLRCFLRENYKIKLKDSEASRVIKDPEFRESLKVEIPKELYDIDSCHGHKLYPMSSIFQYPNQEEYKKYMYQKYIEFRNAFLPDFEDYIEYLGDYKVKHKVYGIIDESPFLFAFTNTSGVYFSQKNKELAMKTYGDNFSLIRVFTAEGLHFLTFNSSIIWKNLDPEIKKANMALITEFINQEEFILKNQKIAS